MNIMPVYSAVGIGDLQLAAKREIRRIIVQAKGDRNEAVRLGLAKLEDLEIITTDDLQALSKLFEVGLQDFGKGSSVEKAYNEARRIFDEMLASGNYGPTALALAAAETNSYVSIGDGEGTTTVVYKKSNWETRLSVVGAGLGAQLAPGWGGPLGAAIGGAIGAAVDECID